MAYRWSGLERAALRRSCRHAYAAALAAILLAPAGCGTDAVGVEACRQVEEARCKQAPACGVTLEPPHRTSGIDVTECIRFYDVACLHGLASGRDPGPVAVSACVAAIHNAQATGTCAVVLSPATVSACAWLTPDSAGSDAASSSGEASAVGDGGGSAE